MKIYISILVILTCGMLVSCGDDNDEQSKYIEKIDDNKFYYKDIEYFIYSDNELYVTGWKNGKFTDSGIVSIESEIEFNGVKKVIGIADKTFSYCNFTRIELPNTIRVIGDKAFSHCCITKIELPNTLRYIGDYAFWACENLDSIYVPNSVESIGIEAFSYCSKLKYIHLPESLTIIPERMLSDCSMIKYVSIPETVNEIGPEAFSYCKRLNHIILPQNIKHINEGCFSHCEELDSIIIPQNVISINSNAFWGCKSLNYVLLNNGLKAIGAFAFGKCESLNSFTIPETVNDLGQYLTTGLYGKGRLGGVWQDCPSLKTVYSYMKNPPLYNNFFHDSDDRTEITLHIPKGYMKTYKNSRWEVSKYTAIVYIIDDL